MSGSLIPSTANTPLDARSVVAKEEDILNISLPYVGMLVFCAENDKYYKITKLGSKSIGALKVDDAVVAAYEELIPAEEDQTTISGPSVLIFDINGIADNDSFSVVVDFSASASFAEYTSYDSADTTANENFKVWGGQTVSQFPSGGIDSVYNGGQVIFSIPKDNTAIFYRYGFRSNSGDTQGSISSMRFGCLTAIRHDIRMTDFTE